MTNMKPEIETVIESLREMYPRIRDLCLVDNESDEHSLEVSLRIWNDGTVTLGMTQTGSSDGLSENERKEFRLPTHNMYNFVDVLNDETTTEEYREAALYSYGYEEVIDNVMDEIIKEIQEDKKEVQ